MEHFKRRAFEFECYWPEDVMEYSWVTVMWKILLMPFQALLAFKSSVLRSKQQTVLQFLRKNMTTEFILDQRKKLNTSIGKWGSETFTNPFYKLLAWNRVFSFFHH
jgi:hypothetical protein